MHEFFLTAVVKDGDFEMARSVMQGFCAMNAWQSLHRVLYFTGPPQPRGLPVEASIHKAPQTEPLWRQLKQVLSRQSFVLQARYEVFKDRHFGKDVFDELNAMPGTLRWTDIPDPIGDRPVTQRKKVEIPDQRNLVRILTENQHRFKNEAIEESQSYFRDNIEFTFVRYYIIPTSGATDQPQSSLPSWEDISLQDPAGKWLLFVKVHVTDDNSPEKMQKAQEQLMLIREELLGVFDFKVIDRRAHDTRVAQQGNNMPLPLPDKVSVGGLEKLAAERAQQLADGYSSWPKEELWDDDDYARLIKSEMDD